MKYSALFLLLIPAFASANWSAPGLSAFSDDGTGVWRSNSTLQKGAYPLTLHNDQQCWQPAADIKLNQMLSLKPCTGDAPQWRVFREGNTRFNSIPAPARQR
jgi:alpha-amylase